MFLVWLPVLLCFEVEEDSGKGQKQVRNKLETTKRQHLPSMDGMTVITPSISSTRNHFSLTVTNSVSSLAARSALF